MFSQFCWGLFISNSRAPVVLFFLYGVQMGGTRINGRGGWVNASSRHLPPVSGRIGVKNRPRSLP